MHGTVPPLPQRCGASHTHTHIHTTHTLTHPTHTHTHTHTQPHPPTHTHPRTRTHRHTHIHPHTHPRTHTTHRHTHIHPHTHPCTHHKHTHTESSPSLLYIFQQNNSNFYNSIIICSFVHCNELEGTYYTVQKEATPDLTAAFGDCNKTTVLSGNNGTIDMSVFCLMSKVMSDTFYTTLMQKRGPQ